jgi:hypothetical protein
MGLCFAAVWAGDYHQLNEAKSAEISQPYKAQPAVHPQLDENEEVSMRKTVLDLRGAIPEAVVKLNVVLDNVVLPTSEIQQLTHSSKISPISPIPPIAATGDETYTLSDTLCAHDNLILTEGECKTAAAALKLKSPDAESDETAYASSQFPKGCLYNQRGAWTAFSLNSVSTFNPQSFEAQSMQCICKISAVATGGKKLDKAHHICLNTQLNELDATYETSLVDYKKKKGADFVVGPVTQWSTAYANAAADQSLADEDFLKVAGMGFLPSSHLLHTAHPGSFMDTSHTTLQNLSAPGLRRQSELRRPFLLPENVSHHRDL